jgi:hypothetical protein
MDYLPPWCLQEEFDRTHSNWAEVTGGDKQLRRQHLDEYIYLRGYRSCLLGRYREIQTDNCQYVTSNVPPD